MVTKESFEESAKCGAGEKKICFYENDLEEDICVCHKTPECDEEA